MEHKKSITKKRFQDAVVAFAAIAFLYLVFHLTGVGCPVKYITGVSCPGCGMTRAWGAVLRGNFAAAFRYHPLWILPIPGAALIIFQKRIPKKVFKISIAVIAACFFIVFVIRMADSGNTIVVFRPSEGLIGRGILWIKNRF